MLIKFVVLTTKYLVLISAASIPEKLWLKICRFNKYNKLKYTAFLCSRLFHLARIYFFFLLYFIFKPHGLCPKIKIFV